MPNIPEAKRLAAQTLLLNEESINYMHLERDVELVADQVGGNLANALKGAAARLNELCTTPPFDDEPILAQVDGIKSLLKEVASMDDEANLL